LSSIFFHVGKVYVDFVVWAFFCLGLKCLIGDAHNG